MRVTIQYFDGCPHWKLADQRLRKVLTGAPGGDVTVDYELINSPETAARVGFRGSPTILVNGQDPFVSGDEPIGLTCRVFRTEAGADGAPTEAQLRRVLSL